MTKYFFHPYWKLSTNAEALNEAMNLASRVKICVGFSTDHQSIGSDNWYCWWSAWCHSTVCTNNIAKDYAMKRIWLTCYNALSFRIQSMANWHILEITVWQEINLTVKAIVVPLTHLKSHYYQRHSHFMPISTVDLITENWQSMKSIYYIWGWPD